MIGLPHSSLGEEVGAAVTLKPGAAIAAKELRNYVKGQVAAYKYPRHVWIVDRCALRIAIPALLHALMFSAVIDVTPAGINRLRRSALPVSRHRDSRVRGASRPSVR